jgi:FAD-dependent urate hydroxylase
MQQLEVVVVGAGIGGLATALALQRSGHWATVLEQTRSLRPVGAGISLWSNGVKVLDALGLGAEVAAVGGRMERLCYRDREGATLCDFSLEPLVLRVGERPYPVRRADLQTLLLDVVGDCVRTGTRCDEIVDHGDGVTVIADDGARFEGDLVVVADGTHSRFREQVVGAPVERRYVGYHNWNGVVPDDLGLGAPDSWVVHVGEGKRVSTMPVRDGQYFFLDVPLTHPVAARADARAKLRHHFTGWDARVQRLIEGFDEDAVANVAIHGHDPIGCFARGRIALLGDSAHTTAPDLGQGGCLAMEDALVLAGILTTTNVGVQDALERYSAARVPRTASIMERAITRARLSHGYDPAATEAWYEELASEDGTRIIDGICRSIVGGPCR